MSVFATLAESRQLGAPVVALFRTALGRDPDALEMARLVPMVRERAPLPDIAALVVITPEFRDRHGGADKPDLVDALCRNAFGAGLEGASTARLAAELSGTDAEIVAAVAGAALAQRRIPLLPGLVPGVGPDDPIAYRLWVAEYDQPDRAAAARLPPLSGQRITVAMASGDTEAEAVQHTVQSLRAQVYTDWELCLAARTLSPWSREAVERLPVEDRRVRLVRDPGLQAAFRAATGTLCCLLVPGDRLPPSALWEVAAAFAAHPDTRLLFTDEDVEDEGGRHSPRFKPGFSPDALLGGDAIGQLAVYRMDLLAEIGGLPDGPDTVRALARRAAEVLAPKQVNHLPAVLCHRGRLPAPLDLDACREGGRFPLPASPPAVTVVVPTKNRADLLGTCVAGVLDRTEYPIIEMVIVDNGSTDPNALALLAELERRPGVRVLRRPGPFNFAALNNAAAAIARDGLLLLLNNDTEVLHPGWLGEMVAHAVRPDVGVVGARLLYPGNTVQHAGILLGPGGTATHVGRGAAPNDPGYLGQLVCVRDLSAVTGACLAISTASWRRVGGMDERLAVAWNDVDLCLRVRKAGLRVVWTPHATLLHRESVTRGLESGDPAQLARFRAEQALVVAEWGEAVERDPFLNANLLALEAGPLVLARPRDRRRVATLPFASKP